MSTCIRQTAASHPKFAVTIEAGKVIFIFWWIFLSDILFLWSWQSNIYFLVNIFVRHTFFMSKSSIKTKTVLTTTQYRHKRSSRMSVSFWNENPHKFIQKWLVPNKFYSGIMWQPGWTSSWTKLIPISCTTLNVFILRASRFALLSEYYKLQ